MYRNGEEMEHMLMLSLHSLLFPRQHVSKKSSGDLDGAEATFACQSMTN